jgi:hypothetical protein
MNLKNEPDRYRGGRACSLHVFFTGAVLFFGASTSAPAELRYWGIRKRGKSRGCQAVAHRCLTIAGKYGTSG